MLIKINHIIHSYTLFKNYITSILNYLFIIYMFFLPLKGPISTVFFIILILLILRGNFIYHIKEQLSNKVIQSLLMFFFIPFIWIIGSDGNNVFLNTIKEMKVFLFPLIFLTFLDKKYLPKSFLAFMIGMLFSEFTSYSIFFELIPPIYTNTSLDPTPFMNHSQYGLLLSLVAGITFYRFIHYRDNTYTRVLTLIFFLSISINIFITGGRTGYMFYGISIFIVLLSTNLKIWKILFYTLASVLIVFSLAYQLSPIFKIRIDESANSLIKLQDYNFHSSFGKRAGLFYYSVPVIKENIIFGVGRKDHIISVYEEVKKNQKDLFLLETTHLHNSHTTVLIQYGMIGFLFWLHIFYQILRYKQENHFSKFLMVLSFTLIFFYSFFAAIFKTNISEIFLAILALSLVKVDKDAFKNILFTQKELIYLILFLPVFVLIKSIS